MTTRTDDTAETIEAALTREHHEIDDALGAVADGLERGEVLTDRLLPALEALRRHIYLEEAFLFPPISEGGLKIPIMVMVREHGELWDVMDQVEDLAGRATDAETQEHLQAMCRGMLTMLDRHNSKEEPVIYPRTTQDLTPEAQAELDEFIRTGQMPDGWVSADAHGA